MMEEKPEKTKKNTHTLVYVICITGCLLVLSCLMVGWSFRNMLFHRQTTLEIQDATKRHLIFIKYDTTVIATKHPDAFVAKITGHINGKAEFVLTTYHAGKPAESGGAHIAIPARKVEGAELRKDFYGGDGVYVDYIPISVTKGHLKIEFGYSGLPF